MKNKIYWPTEWSSIVANSVNFMDVLESISKKKIKTYAKIDFLSQRGYILWLTVEHKNVHALKFKVKCVFIIKSFLRKKKLYQWKCPTTYRIGATQNMCRLTKQSYFHWSYLFVVVLGGRFLLWAISSTFAPLLRQFSALSVW